MKTEESEAEKSGLVYRYTLQSQPFTSRSHYAVGVFHGNELHLTHVSSLQRFVPVLRNNPTRSLPVGALRVEEAHCSKQWKLEQVKVPCQG